MPAMTNPCNSSDYKICVKAHKIHHVLTMPARKRNVTQLVWTKHIPCQRRRKIYLHLFDENPPTPARTHIASQNPLQFLLSQNIFLNMWGLTSACEDSKCFSTPVEKTHLMPVSTQNVFLLVFNKPIPCQRGRKMNINIYWPNPSHSIGDTNSFSTNVDPTHFIPART